MPLTVRALLIAAVLSTACTIVFATRVFVRFDAIHTTVLATSTRPEGGVIRVPLDDSNLASLRSPFAIVAHITNDARSAQPFVITLDGDSICKVEVGARKQQRIDCAAVHELAGGPHGITVASGRQPWSLDSLELATHHGRSGGLLTLFILPRGSTQVVRPSVITILLLWIVLTAGFTLPSCRPSGNTARYVCSALGSIATALLLAVMLSPFISSYLIVLSPRTFLIALAALFMPRVFWVAAFSRSQAHKVTSTRRFAQVRATTFRLVTSRRRDPWIAVVLASGLAGLAVAYGTRDVGGADEYGYVSQAELWLNGQLKINQSFIAAAPWRRAAWTFSPLGYRSTDVCWFLSTRPVFPSLWHWQRR
jgi:hypothetical protein